ncbi:MAG: Ribonucleoside-diphosphate reductase [Candidatus Woesebacteria bacterium GW2011_GWA2_40_7b]|uniref:Vitamin B12-dependent ribonucleotide reductase n=1 Tax=Candidatus Woesebacteria bacterium GW2011_GWA2_40_7b TaxID=1618563 RepID=A0A0G0VGT4_9BACT|nr:MAG: Ribonucleoside-diphosphate reductase [Candidatus Woesebacteria bacterium GW2011_GWA2_40_7b]
MQVQTGKSKNSYAKSGKRKIFYKNGETKISVDELFAPSYEEVMVQIKKKVGERPELPRDLPRGEWTEQSIRVLKERYLVKDENLELIENPEEMVWRVAWEAASAESRWGKNKKEVLSEARNFYELMVSRKFLPNSPTLMNAGTGNGLQYSACFVLPVEDSLIGIFDAVKYQALIHQTGGGTGFSFSRLRPSGSVVKSSHGTASGPVSFMRIFDAATNEIKQGGKRRGANMGILRVDHPDILEFIHCKETGGITNFNISVAITDAFMDAYKKDQDYKLIDPKTKKIAGKLSARRVFDEISLGAWKTGDPGLIFIDRRNRGASNPVPSLGPIEATNPCGEQELYPYDACNLGSIFLGYFVKDNEIMWEALGDAAKTATRFLDNIIEVNPFPLDQIRKTVFNIRRIGLGVGGWADLLIELGIPYDSDEAMALGAKVMKFIYEEAVKEDKKLARERGAFPLWPVSIYRDQDMRRNSTITTIAPTGTISIIAGASSGIEPLFAIAFQHIVKDKHLDRKLTFIEPKFERVAKARGFWSEELMEKVAVKGVVRDIEEIPEDVRATFGTAHEIDIDWHIKTQAVFQKYTENAVSKTINLRHDATVEDVKKAYLMAWQTNCKGITIFRDGSKSAQVLNLGVNNSEESVEEAVFQKQLVLERPVKVEGATYKIATPFGNAFITINQDSAGNPFEIFIMIGKAGSEISAMAEALGRVISTTFRFGNHLPARERAREIMEQLKGIGGGRSVGFGPNKIKSLPDAVARVLSMHFGFSTSHINEQTPTDMAAHNVTTQSETFLSNPTPAVVEFEAKRADICPSCGANALVYEEGCAKCHACGHSEC